MTRFFIDFVQSLYRVDPIFFHKSLKVSRGGYESLNFLDFFQIDNVPEFIVVIFWSLILFCDNLHYPILSFMVYTAASVSETLISMSVYHELSFNRLYYGIDVKSN